MLRFSMLVNAEFQSGAASDPAEYVRKFIVALEFQPVREAVLSGSTMHFSRATRYVHRAQTLGTEFVTERA